MSKLFLWLFFFIFGAGAIQSSAGPATKRRRRRSGISLSRQEAELTRAELYTLLRLAPQTTESEPIPNPTANSNPGSHEPSANQPESQPSPPSPPSPN
eukprot:gene614-512_t